MTKLIFIIIIPITLLFSATNIDKKIEQNKKILDNSSNKKKQTTQKVKELANRIDRQNRNIIKLEQDIQKVNSDIEKHQKLLEESKSKLEELKKRSSKLITEKKNNEEEIVDTIIEEFSVSIALKLASENSLQELIDSEIYTLLSQNSKDKILELNNNYNLVSSNTRTNQKNIDKISSYIEERQKTKETLNNLKEKHSKSLVSLEDQHKSYQKELTKVVEQQESLKQLLSQLNILKAEEIKKAREIERKRRLKALMEQKKKQASQSKNKDVDEIKTAEVRNQEYADNLNLDVRKIGSSTDGVKIVRYRGSKTIPPLKSFKVVKKFGTYYDPIYKIKLFNESVVLKSKIPKAKVVSVLNGKVVYAKKNAGMLENVVIIQHENGLHTIYSHLDEIAPTLKVGKWVKKGYVVGRVDDSLTFQATKNSSHINPKDLFRI
ncbi:peptidase M23 [Malaciobacter pacificus]|uniref:Zinc metallopeptidase, M23 family n=1 Tax=Malaciobacter pacificus TaxID=1080223 RepID=A0A5C2H5W2_9BACT|nr:M23 family metallopeptidase [Malaciobacter pacificus]QEP34203.1 zinc metallopeptidase, M23 family [Malaciobacter pacificus]GGD39673.1 peptidase M23 [Malaciobacter pacificus]